MIVGIIGNGFVGSALYQLKCKDIDILVYDINSELCIPKEIVLNDLNKCDIIFISVPTPCLLYTSPSPRDRQKSRMPSSA